MRELAANFLDQGITLSSPMVARVSWCQLLFLNLELIAPLADPEDLKGSLEDTAAMLYKLNCPPSQVSSIHTLHCSA